MRRHAAVTAVIAAFLLALLVQSTPAATYVWDLPPGFPAPAVPAHNPMSAAKVELGRHLFYDRRLSINGRQSCASCHEQARAFTDGRARAIGATGEEHPRGSMSLVNVAYAGVLTWADTRVSSLEEQAAIPMFGRHPVELGLSPDGPWRSAIAADAAYQRLFEDAFGRGRDLVTVERVVTALASFQRSIVSARSPFDRYRQTRDVSAISDAARRGEVLFHSRPMSCFRCHGGFLFGGAAISAGRDRGIPELHNTGLYNLPGLLSYPAGNTGLHAATGDLGDVGKFKAPTLRNIALTAPYMHDGSVATLEAAIRHYAAGGRTIAGGPLAGVGRDNPNRSPTIRGFALTADQEADLVAFLQTLTDEEVTRDPRFSDPRAQARPAAEVADVLVFAAASLQTALDDLVAPAQAATGIRMRVSYAASSALARQLEHGAPAGVFISADLEWMDYLAERRLIQPDTRVNLLGNRLVLIAPKSSSPPALRIAPGFPLAAALGGRERLALADPDAVPAGRYARAALTQLGVWESVATRIAAAENVRAALALVARGEAPLGIVYRTDLLVEPGVVLVDTFPESAHPPIVYPAAVTAGGTADAARLLAFLQTPAARAVFERHGFSRPCTVSHLSCRGTGAELLSMRQELHHGKSSGNRD